MQGVPLPYVKVNVLMDQQSMGSNRSSPAYLTATV